ncbi:helical backbone metal receptor [Pedobacter sp. SYSU D00535]|uniref:helical backbone metal receptor n=1 Tax=Pedobacter sp. SYSU D00535 TaxID=2810308 RepID=UPI001A969BF1|nr:helical backbone metal receptor [Pedobacter sp. SYSU D00535]
MPNLIERTDQLHRKILIPYLPKRIISLVPSHTETLYDLGLSDRIVGVTKFCIRPTKELLAVEKVGGTKRLDLYKIKQLKPDLIIANKEENTREEIEKLMQQYPVWISDIYTLEDATSMITSVGEIVGREVAARQIAMEIERGFETLRPLRQPLRVAYFIWKNPHMVAAKNTFIDHILSLAGFENFFNQDRYPVLEEDELRRANPDVVFLSSEPYPFSNKHLEEFSELFPHSKLVLVDGEMFSWYGSRLKSTPQYLQKIILDNF